MWRVLQTEKPSHTEENRRLHKAIVEGVDIEYFGEDGVISGEQVRLIDFDDPDANDWLAVNQFTVIENKANRRPDVVIFVNGLPLGVIELKNPGDENATLDGAFNQLQTYKAQITSLFRTNAVLVISDGIAARIGSLTADRERFMPWRTVTGDDLAPKGTPELETVLKGVFDKRRFLDLIKDFIVFGDTRQRMSSRFSPAITSSTPCATPWHARSRRRARWRPQGRRDLAHARLRQEPADGVLRRADHQAPGDGEPDAGDLLTDRNDLDDQLFGTFSMCKDLLRQTPQQAEDRDDLRKLLDRPSGGVIFTTLQKFSPEDGDNRLSGADRPPQRDRDRRRGAPQPVRLQGQGRAARPAKSPTASPNICATPCPTPPSSASPARRSRRTT